MTLRALFAGLLAALLLANCKPAATIEPAAKVNGKVNETTDVIPHAMLGDNVTPTAYRLELVMNPDDDGYKGVVEIDVIIANPTSKIWLHGKEMTVTGAKAQLTSGKSIDLKFTSLPSDEAPSGIAKLTSETPLPSGAATLILPYETPYNMNLNSAYKVERDGEAYIVTQFEPLGAREAFPSFDEPRFKVPFTLSITAPSDDFVYANTPENLSVVLDNGWIKHDFDTTPPLPTYLVAFGVGPYEVVEYVDLPPTDVRDRPVKLRGIAAKGQKDRFEYALKNTAGILEAIENYFGIPYPYQKLDLIAAPDYAFGAMENPGAIVYREYLLLLDDNAPLSQKRSYARVHSHELAHQWFGNLVTPFWWEDIWLNEAFATWMGNKGTSLWQPEGNFDRGTLKSALGAMNLDALSSTRAVREPLERTENVMHQFDSITYRKGGGVLSMFESYLGEENFRKGVQLHMKRFEHDVATADDFFQSLADGSSNPDVVSALKSFVDQPGLPLVSAEISCDGTSTKVELTQSRYAQLGSDPISNLFQEQKWQIPVCMKYGRGSESIKSCHWLGDSRRSSDMKVIVNVQGETCVDYVMLNENGSGYYRFSLDDVSWASLLANLDHLNSREVLATQDSLLAAYRAGDVKSSIYLKGMAAFASHPEYDVVSKSGDLLKWMGTELPDSAKSDYQRFVTGLYKDRFNTSVGQNNLDGALLAPSLLDELVYYAKDLETLATYGAQGAAYLGLDGKADKNAVESNLMSGAFAATMMIREEDAFEPLLDMAVSGSPLEKGAALAALSDIADADRAQRLLEVALRDDGAMTGRQATAIVNGLLVHEKHQGSTWDWLKTNFEAYVTARVPDVRRSRMPAYAKVFCSKEKRDEVEEFFTQNASVIPGYERSLAQTLESIELCTALKAHKGQEMAKALKHFTFD